MAKKMCEICGEKPASIPDRERIGRLINRMTKKIPPATMTRTIPTETQGFQLSDAIKSIKNDYIIYFRYPSGKEIQIAIPVDEDQVMPDQTYGLKNERE